MHRSFRDLTDRKVPSFCEQGTQVGRLPVFLLLRRMARRLTPATRTAALLTMSATPDLAADHNGTESEEAGRAGKRTRTGFSSRRMGVSRRPRSNRPSATTMDVWTQGTVPLTRYGLAGHQGTSFAAHALLAAFAAHAAHAGFAALAAFAAFAHAIAAAVALGLDANGEEHEAELQGFQQ